MSGTAGHAYRYALYLAPPEPWREVGSRWLGRCAETGAGLRVAGADPRLQAWTQAPCLYGLHATLKAPFRLASGSSPAALDQAVRQFASTCSAFDVRLERRALRSFLAWCLAGSEADQQPMQALSERAVADLDAYRAPPGAAELARRRAHDLTSEEHAMLARWGYPYAFGTFTFHITLTGKLDDAALAQADALFGRSGGDELPDTVPVDHVSLYVQPAEDAPFIVARHYGFDGSTRDAIGAAFLAPEGVAP